MENAAASSVDAPLIINDFASNGKFFFAKFLGESRS